MTNIPPTIGIDAMLDVLGSQSIRGTLRGLETIIDALEERISLGDTYDGDLGKVASRVALAIDRLNRECQQEILHSSRRNHLRERLRSIQHNLRCT